MTVNINEVREQARTIVTKRQRSFPNGDEFTQLANAVNFDLFNELSSPLADYKPNSAIPRLSFDITQAVTDYLLPFKSNPTTLFIQTDGTASYPSDYAHLLAAGKNFVSSPGYIDSNGQFVPTEFEEGDIEELDESELRSRLRSYIRKPDEKHPVCVLYKDKIQFYPKDLNTAKIVYLASPVNVKWAYTIVSGREVYDPTNSVDFQWKATNKNDLVFRILQYMGIKIRDNELFAFAGQLRNENQ